MRILPYAILLACALFFSAPALSDDAAEDAQVNSLVVTDAQNKLAGQVVDYHTGAYSMLHEGGFSDSEIREFMRPILEQHGFSEQSIVKYFNLFDPNYHGGEKQRVEDQKKIVESLLN
jgi:hypothetical protein